jgi:hypothetical protein
MTDLALQGISLDSFPDDATGEAKRFRVTLVFADPSLRDVLEGLGYPVEGWVDPAPKSAEIWVNSGLPPRQVASVLRSLADILEEGPPE